MGAQRGLHQYKVWCKKLKDDRTWLGLTSEQVVRMVGVQPGRHSVLQKLAHASASLNLIADYAAVSAAIVRFHSQSQPLKNIFENPLPPIDRLDAHFFLKGGTPTVSLSRSTTGTNMPKPDIQLAWQTLRKWFAESCQLLNNWRKIMRNTRMTIMNLNLPSVCLVI